MINKRLLIKNLLAHNDECSFFDKKRQLNLEYREGKAKFLKHICALSNSNPINNSYIIVGVEDVDNEMLGVDFFDDSRIQNLVNAFLENPPKIQYENVHFPNLSKDKVIGLVTIRPKKNLSYFKKSIHTILVSTIYARIGSNTQQVYEDFQKNYQNNEIVVSIENNSRNSIGHTLDGVFDFVNHSHKDFSPKYKVFKELFVICWAGTQNRIKGKIYLSRVDIELINEQVKLFYSAHDVVEILYDEHSFTILEFIPLGLNDKTSLYLFERVTLRFFENGYYKLENQMLFEPPQFNRKMLHHIFNSNLALLNKLEQSIPLTPIEEKDLINLPSTFMICYLNGFNEAKEILINQKDVLKNYSKSDVYIHFKEVMRILRKMKYDVNRE